MTTENKIITCCPECWNECFEVEITGSGQEPNFEFGQINHA